MSVYFIRSAGLIKIGYSNDVRTRVRAVIGSLREGGEFIGCMPGGRDLEQYFHRKFAADREYGEWFRPSDALATLIETAATPSYPDDEKAASIDRLQLQEERYAEEAAYFIRTFFVGITPTAKVFDLLANTTAIAAPRLKAIYAGTVCPITAGEYVVLRTVHDAAGERPGAAVITEEDHREFLDHIGGRLDRP